MAAFFDSLTGRLAPLNEDHVINVLGDGTESDIEEFHDEELENVDSQMLAPLDNLQDEVNQFEDDSSDEEMNAKSGPSSASGEQRCKVVSRRSLNLLSGARIVRRDDPVRDNRRSNIEISRPSFTQLNKSNQEENPEPVPSPTSSAEQRSQVVCRRNLNLARVERRYDPLRSRGSNRQEIYRPVARQLNRSGSRGDTWKKILFCDKPHDYETLPKNPVRSPTEYFTDYFDDTLYEEISRCTNLYHMRTTGQQLKTTRAEIAKVFGVHIIMGCIPYPRTPMYWRAETKLKLISDKISRDRFLTIRNALHVVDHDTPTECEKLNPLWKVQPLINKVKSTCNKLERIPSYYSIDEQMIPFTGRCSLRQVVKNKPRPVGLKNFVLTTSEGLMLNFAIYRGAKTMFEETTLGLGPSVILHLVQSVPPGSCVYHDRYFTTIPLLEEMAKRDLHSTGTIMFNRIPDRAALKFSKDSAMKRGESEQYVKEPTSIVKWKDSKSVIMASNCTGSSTSTTVKRWDKQRKCFIDISAPKVIQLYNRHMGGVGILDQQIEYYRTFIKTKKWTLKVLIHFMDLSLANAWRLYKNDCVANSYLRKDTIPLLDFRLNVADALMNIPDRQRRSDESENEPTLANKQYRPIRPSQGKRYDGYDHLAYFDDNLKAPRTCMFEQCSSRSKVKCNKCSVYLCLSRSKNCFMFYHQKP